jgi:glycine C-acetyltransferase/8-amino-7-oxononanoate synthase
MSASRSNAKHKKFANKRNSLPMKTSMQSPAGAVTVINGRGMDYFCGCGYLGLQNHPAVIAAADEALKKYGLSTATSRGGYGEHPVYDELEKQAALSFGCERLLYFASGYMGAAILVQTSLQPNDHFFLEESAHFSLWDAAAMSNHAVSSFHHLSPASLTACLKAELQPGERPVLLTDGLFPISGEIAPLPAYLEILHPLHGRLIVDDAHAVGVLGVHGRGSAEYFGLAEHECETTATFNKALGGYGGFICGTTRVINLLEQNSRIFIGSSPPPLPAAAASAKALQILREDPSLLISLRQNVSLLRQGLHQTGWNVAADSPSPIVCLQSKGKLNPFQLCNRLYEKGIAVEYVTGYPSTPAGGALRLAVFATHTSAQIERLVGELAPTAHK